MGKPVDVLTYIEKEIELFRKDVVYLREDIRIGTLTLDDRLDTVYIRLCKNLDRLTAIKKDFYKRNSLPLDELEQEFPDNRPPVVKYEEETVDESVESETEEKNVHSD